MTGESPDYTGVPAGQLRAQIEQNLGGKSKRWLSEKTGIDPRELDRIMTKAPDRAVIGLGKADRILLALRQSINVLEMLGEVNVVPLGANLKNAKLMAEDMFHAQGDENPHPRDVLGLAHCLQQYKLEALDRLTKVTLSEAA